MNGPDNNNADYFDKQFDGKHWHLWLAAGQGLTIEYVDGPDAPDVGDDTIDTNALFRLPGCFHKRSRAITRAKSAKRKGRVLILECWVEYESGCQRHRVECVESSAAA